MDKEISVDGAEDREMNGSSPLLPAAAPQGAETRPPFDSVSIGLHWASVLLVLALFGSAVLHAQVQDGVSRALLLQVHRSLGVVIWVTTAFRLGWRVTIAKLPPFPASMTRLHRMIVHLSEYGLYALLLGLPAAGLGATILRGRPFALFSWQIPQFAAPDRALAAQFQSVHEFGALALGALVAVHAGAALFHHFVLRDDVLHSMAPVVTARRSRPI
jgi:cytochrome b561